MNVRSEYSRGQRVHLGYDDTLLLPSSWHVILPCPVPGKGLLAVLQLGTRLAHNTAEETAWCSPPTTSIVVHTFAGIDLQPQQNYRHSLPLAPHSRHLVL